MEFVGDQDNVKVNNTMSNIYWDRIVTAGKIARFQFILKNSNNLQMNSSMLPS